MQPAAPLIGLATEVGAQKAELAPVVHPSAIGGFDGCADAVGGSGAKRNETHLAKVAHQFQVTHL